MLLHEINIAYSLLILPVWAYREQFLFENVIFISIYAALNAVKIAAEGSLNRAHLGNVG
jgi:hypothetical protein